MDYTYLCTYLVKKQYIYIQTHTQFYSVYLPFVVVDMASKHRPTTVICSNIGGIY